MTQLDVGGIVFIPLDPYVIVWPGLKTFLRQRHYEPSQFYAELRKNCPRAIKIAKEIVELGKEKYGSGTGLGWHTGNGVFHRLRLDARVSVCGTIQAEIRIA